MFEKFKKKLQDLRFQNIIEVRNTIESGSGREYTALLKKVNNWRDKWPDKWTEDEILNQILANDLVASKFCKDPSRQNPYETIALEILREGNLNVEKAGYILYCAEGELFHEHQVGHKSVDFIEESTILYSHKYTNESGGAQDNQFHNLRDFVIQAAKYVKKYDDDYRFVALADGAYYQGVKMQQLKDCATSTRIFVGTTEGYVRFRNE